MSVKNPWTTLSSQTIYDNPWIRVTEHQVLNPNGKPGVYGTVSFKNLAIGVLPVDREGYTYLVGQYRYPLDVYSWEIPEGGGRLGEEPLNGAQRELKEETGFTAGRWDFLQELQLSNSVTDERAVIFLARELVAGESEPEDTEELRVRRVPLQEAFGMVERGEITDAISVAALQRLQVLMLSGRAI